MSILNRCHPALLAGTVKIHLYPEVIPSLRARASGEVMYDGEIHIPDTVRTLSLREDVSLWTVSMSHSHLQFLGMVCFKAS